MAHSQIAAGEVVTVQQLLMGEIEKKPVSML